MSEENKQAPTGQTKTSAEEAGMGFKMKKKPEVVEKAEEKVDTESHGFKVGEQKGKSGLLAAQKTEKAEETQEEVPPVVESASTTEETTTEGESSQEAQGDDTENADDTDGEGSEDNQPV